MRETKAQRIEREHADLTVEVARLSVSWEREHAEVRRLEERCSFLYETGLILVDEQVRARLTGMTTGPIVPVARLDGDDGSVPRLAPSTLARLTKR